MKVYLKGDVVIGGASFVATQWLIVEDVTGQKLIEAGVAEQNEEHGGWVYAPGDWEV